MDKWKATTESGTTYEMRDGIVKVVPKDGAGYSIQVWKMQAATKVGDKYHALGLPWSDPTSWEDSTRPVMGRRMYVQGKDEWRISTPIVSVEDL
jgi:hypothetical protein